MNPDFKPRAYRRMVERYERARPRNKLARPGCHEFVIVLDHLKPEFNVGKIFRSADAFGAAEVHLVGVGPFDPKPSMGGYRHVPAREFENLEDSFADLRRRGYILYALDPAGPTPANTCYFPSKSAFILGHEEFGLSFDPASQSDIRVIRIPQFGAVESLNVSIAASILMYEYVRQRTTPTARDG